MLNYSTTDISTICLLIEKTYELYKDLYIRFLDLKAIFDTIWHSSLWSLQQAVTLAVTSTDIDRDKVKLQKKTVE